MKIKINQTLKGVDGKQELPNVDEKRPLTIKDVCISALLTPIDGEDEKSKFSRWEIFKLLREATDQVDLTLEQLSLVKKYVGKFQPPLIMGQVFDLIEGK